ncbi:MAG TPA: hypothetical protein V6C95_17925 [Coleofasciculaceae cyanobacterium]
MIPTNTTAQKTLVALEFARDALLIELNTIYQLMLEDALKGKFDQDMILGIQKELVPLQTVQQKIDEAIALLRDSP